MNNTKNLKINANEFEQLKIQKSSYLKNSKTSLLGHMKTLRKYQQ